jgi:hypothetical protein
MRKLIFTITFAAMLCLSGCGKEQDTEPAAPVSEYSTIELSGEKHLISDPNSKYEYEIDSSFKATESHAAEVSVLSVYAPDKDTWNESDLPRVYLLSDEWISYAIEEFKEKGTFENAIEAESTDGTGYVFKATIEYYGDMIYLYCIEKDNLCFCMNYPKDYVGTEKETILKKVLDDAVLRERSK